MDDRRDTAEKLRIVEESLNAGISVVEFARQRDLHPNLVHTWRWQARKGMLSETVSASACCRAAGPTFSSTWVFSRACSAGWSWRSSPPLLAPEHYSSSASTLRWQNARAFAAYLAPLHNSKWVVTANDPSGDPRKFCATSPAIPSSGS